MHGAAGGTSASLRVSGFLPLYGCSCRFCLRAVLSQPQPLPWGCMKQLIVSVCETCNDTKTILQRGPFLEQLDLDHCAGPFLGCRSTQTGEEMMVPNGCRREGRGASFSNVLGSPCSSRGCRTVPGLPLCRETPTSWEGHWRSCAAGGCTLWFGGGGAVPW